MSKRIVSIDLIRGGAIFMMIQTHIWQKFIAPDSKYELLTKFFVIPFGGYAAPLFILISGLSAFLAWDSYNKQGKTYKKVLSVFFKRGGALFLFSTAINIILRAVGFKEIFILNWGTIQLIGFCQMVIPLFMRTNKIVRLLFIVIPLVAANFLPALSQIFPFLFQGFAPIFPWGALYFTGTIAGEWFTKNYSVMSATSFQVGVFFAIIMLIYILNQYYPFNNWDKTQGVNLTTYLIYSIVFISVLALAKRIEKVKNMFLVEIFSEFGRRALSIYYFQLFSIIGLAYILGNILLVDYKLGGIWFFPLLIIYLIILFMVFNVTWKKYNYKFSLEWFIRKI